MQAFELHEMTARQQEGGKAYHEFLRVPDLSMGLYHLEVGSVDPQSPHTEDELYYVVSGEARITVAGEEREVRAGSLVYVPKDKEHRFHSIETDLTVLVLFAPAEYSNSSRAGDGSR
jgi:mannose-6-phosphate isomerase-like protein (cupin superfamily)